MAEPLPIVLAPGLLTSPRVYAAQLSALWKHGPVTIADNTRDDTMAAIASRILADAPPRFALAGLSMGGYICFELARQAPTESPGWPCWTQAPVPTPRSSPSGARPR